MYILKLYGVGSFCRTAKKTNPSSLIKLQEKQESKNEAHIGKLIKNTTTIKGDH